MRIAVLTSSRADYGIYLPLLKMMKKDPYFDLKIIAFGTHLSPYHGCTVRQIESDGFEVTHRIESMLQSDSSEAISTAMSLTMMKFASFWAVHHDAFDLVFCLGDRYEMFAAVSAGIPFNIRLAHLHGGETTLGAIDNVFRHSLSFSSFYHFTSTEEYRNRLIGMLDDTSHVYHVGALSLDNIGAIRLLSAIEFRERWGIDLDHPTVLVTFHPETLSVNKNINYVEELVKAIKLNPTYQYLITLPNADTEGNAIREVFRAEFEDCDNVHQIENLGTQSYFTAMSLCAFLLGNTSSGIIEAASFSKYVINIGDRQKGRVAGNNVIHSPINAKKICEKVAIVQTSPAPDGQNPYYNGGAANRIINILKEEIRF